MRKNKTWLVCLGIAGSMILAAGIVWGYHSWGEMASAVDIVTVNTEAPYEEGCETNNDWIPDELADIVVEMMDEHEMKTYLSFITQLEEKGYQSSDFRGSIAKKNGRDAGIMTYFVMKKDAKKIQFHIQNTYVPSCGTIDLSQSLPSVLHGDEVYLFQNHKQIQAFAIKDDIRYGAYFYGMEMQEVISVMKAVLKQP